MSNKLEIPRLVKWAGGKSLLMQQYISLFPKKFNRYLEPFVGGGAVFFYLVQKYKIKEAILSDTNEELMNAYEMVRDNVEELIIELKQHKAYHIADKKKYYYEIRGVDPSLLPDLERAARFIYLNRTCFNGLYRVNSKGGFNVPIGSYKNPDVVREDILRLVSKLLKNVKLKVMPFEKVVKMAKKGDFVYMDPPYYPLKKTSFTSYAKDVFLDKEHKQLADAFKKLDKKGCFVMESNSDAKFVHDLYEDFTIHTVKARRLINSDASKRGKINEVVIVNY